MKQIDVSLTDQHAALIEASVASGDYASASEVVRTALRAFFRDEATPPVEQMAAEIDAMEQELAAGEALLSVDEVRRGLAERRDG